MNPGTAIGALAFVVLIAPVGFLIRDLIAARRERREREAHFARLLRIR